jgi:polyisoprenoid-binding protein YceI
MSTATQFETSPASSTVTAPTVAPAAATWDIDSSHANAGFRVRHLMVSHVRGQLGPVTGTAFIDQRDLTKSRLDVNVDVRGIDTRDPKRDEHLRSADFFDVEHHPTVTFRSTRVEAPSGAEGNLRVTGDLTMRGVTLPVTLEVEPLPPAIRDPWGNARVGVLARGRLSRKAWGLQWNLALEAGGLAVSDEVVIEIDAELTTRPA